MALYVSYRIEKQNLDNINTNNSNQTYRYYIYKIKLEKNENEKKRSKRCRFLRNTTTKWKLLVHAVIDTFYFVLSCMWIQFESILYFTIITRFRLLLLYFIVGGKESNKINQILIRIFSDFVFSCCILQIIWTYV